MGLNCLSKPNNGHRRRAVLLERLVAQPEGEPFGAPRSDPAQGVRRPPAQRGRPFEHDRVPSRTQLARHGQQDARPRVDPAARDGVRVVDEHDQHGLGTRALGCLVLGVEGPKVSALSASARCPSRILALATHRVRGVLWSCARDEAGALLTQLAQRALSEPVRRAQGSPDSVLCALRHRLAREEERWRRTSCSLSASVRQRCSGTARSRRTVASTHAPRCAATGNPRRQARTRPGCLRCSRILPHCRFWHSGHRRLPAATR